MTPFFLDVDVIRNRSVEEVDVIGNRSVEEVDVIRNRSVEEVSELLGLVLGTKSGAARIVYSFLRQGNPSTFGTGPSPERYWSVLAFGYRHR